MKIGIIGAGRVGCAFAFALSDRGAEISGVFSKNPESAAFVAAKLDRRPETGLDGMDRQDGTDRQNRQDGTDRQNRLNRLNGLDGMDGMDGMDRLVKSSDVVILSVPDSLIASVSGKISGLCSRVDIDGRIFLHCSGALTSDALRELCGKGGLTGSLHPIQTFSERENSWKGMFNIYFGFEGSNAARQAAAGIVRLLGGKMLEIRADAKPLYHAAACILSNYMVTLSDVAGSLLESAGIGREAGIKALEPLISKTAANIVSLGAVNALTGPIARGDADTVAGHLSAIDMANPQVADLYKVLGRATVGLALVKGTIANNEALALLEILK